MGFLDSLAGGIGNLFTGGANLLGKGAGAVGSGLGSLFGSFGQGMGSMGGGGNSGGMPPNPFGGSSMGGQASSNAMSSGGQQGGFSGLFGRYPIASGLGTIFGSQLIGNPKLPELPDSFKQFQQQANAGGPPIQQQSNQYLQSVISGQNTSANDAATHSLDLNYQEQLRQLNGMYKSLRPGTDPTSDTTYQRDLQNLNDVYARQRAQVLSQQQQGAAGLGLQAGQEQANQQMSAIDTQVSQIAAQYGLDAQKQAALRNMLMQLGGTMGNYGALQSLFPNAFQGQNTGRT